MVNMDFIAGLPWSLKIHDSIWVIMDKRTKSTHFLTIKTTNTGEDYAILYIQEITSLYGVSLSIISNKKTPFTA